MVLEQPSQSWWHEFWIMVSIASSLSKNAGAVRPLWVFFGLFVCFFNPCLWPMESMLLKDQVEFPSQGYEWKLLSFFLSGLHGSLQSTDPYPSKKKRVCAMARPGWSRVRACGLGPGAGIPHTDSESAARDRSGGSIESHSVPCHQVTLTHNTHTAAENGVFERSVIFP